MLYSPQTVRLSLDTSSLKVNNSPISGTIRTTVNNNLILEGVVSQTGDTAGPVRLIVWSISDGYNSTAFWASQPVMMNPSDNVRFYVSFIPPHSGDYLVQVQTQLGGPPSSVPLTWATIGNSATITIGVFGSQDDINRVPSGNPQGQSGSGGLPAVAQIMKVSVNGVNVPKGGTINLAQSDDIPVTITILNVNNGTVRERAWVSNITPPCIRTRIGCYAAPDIPGDDGNGGVILASGLRLTETCRAAYSGGLLTLQAEAQYQDDHAQYHLDDTWQFTIAPLGYVPPGTGTGTPGTAGGTGSPIDTGTGTPGTAGGTGSPIDTGTGTGDGSKKDTPIDWMPIIVVGAVGAAIIGLLVVVLRPQHSF